MTKSASSSPQGMNNISDGVPTPAIQSLDGLYEYSGDISLISMIRQHETYSSPQMNEASDLFTINPQANDALQAKLGALGTSEDPNYQFWVSVIEDYGQFVAQKRVSEIEKHIVEGIPDNLRALVYSRVVQIRYKFNTKEGYMNLVKQAKSGTGCRSQDSYIERLDFDQNWKDILRTFNYYTNGVVGGTASLKVEDPNTEKLPPNTFVIHISKLLENLTGLDDEETLFLLLKLNKLFVGLIKNEFYYKINRSLESIVGEAFNHMSVQGINFHNIYKQILFNFFDTKIEDPAVLMKLLDFVVVEGFDFILRFIVWVFSQQQTRILALNGDELNEFVNSKQLFALDINWQQVLELEPQPSIVKYENEYHLMHANSLNNIGNELTNLREINDELNIKIGEINHQLENLQTTHSEILEQSESFKQRLTEAQAQNEELARLQNQLQEKYDSLTMQENLKNTIKANKDFSKRNSELEAQIAELRNKVEEKRGRLGIVAE